jgi:hypothetical protein
MNDQRALNDQLQDLVGIANQHGMYDAADFLRDLLQNKPYNRGSGKFEPLCNVIKDLGGKS